MGLMQEEYVIWLRNNVLVKSYTPWNTPEVKKANEGELDKLEKAEFIESSISPYSAPTLCVDKPEGTLRVTFDF